jgi:hypothetical protein
MKKLKNLKRFTVLVTSYSQITYAVKAVNLNEAKKLYNDGMLGEDCITARGGVLDGEIVSEDWEEG